MVKQSGLQVTIPSFGPSDRRSMIPTGTFILERSPLRLTIHSESTCSSFSNDDVSYVTSDTNFCV